MFVLPIFVGLLLDAHFVPKILNKVGKGPGNLTLWFGTIVFAVVGILLISWVWASNFLVSMPLVVAVLVCGAAGALWLEKSHSQVTRLALLGVSTKIDKTFTGGEARSALRGEMPIIKVATLADGRTVVIRRGIVPFLARLWGGAAVLNNADRIKSELELTGKSAADKLVFIDEDADVTYEYSPEGFAFELDTRTADGRLDITGILNHLGELAIGGAVGYYLGGPLAAILGAIGVVVFVHTHAVNGVARFTPAQGHFGDAVVTAMQLEKGIDENRQREELLRELRSEIRRSEDVVEEVRNANDESVIGSAHERDIDWPDDELTSERPHAGRRANTSGDG
ncbi:hypothetical protein [Halosegnis marinus]|uniref:Uncharacterized protein n=1 Tax=Halosegnis marinus TaxID=3034023 RepID=A0ABD5ZSH5_9EURY|nr:hypothetical protein [Halosegnis sp. DT85]